MLQNGPGNKLSCVREKGRVFFVVSMARYCDFAMMAVFAAIIIPLTHQTALVFFVKGSRGRGDSKRRPQATLKQFSYHLFVLFDAMVMNVQRIV